MEVNQAILWRVQKLDSLDDSKGVSSMWSRYRDVHNRSTCRRKRMEPNEMDACTHIFIFTYPISLQMRIDCATRVDALRCERILARGEASARIKFRCEEPKL